MLHLFYSPPDAADEPAASGPDAELLAAARRWISDCSWDDLDHDAIEDLTGAEVLAGIERHFDGGWRALEAIERSTPHRQAA